jgi:Holliday junction resolvase RusA-like endonuclease
VIVNIRVPIAPPPTHQAALRVLKNKHGKMFIGKMSTSKASKWALNFSVLINQWKPKQPMEGALRASIHFAYPLLARHKNRMLVEAKMTRPDCDNLVKSVLDCLVKSGYMIDDANIAHLSVTKSYHWKAPFVDVIITEEKNNPFTDPTLWKEDEETV